MNQNDGSTSKILDEVNTALDTNGDGTDATAQSDGIATAFIGDDGVKAVYAPTESA
jgi:hypothetical protein